MPYITRDNAEELTRRHADNPAELNYRFSWLIGRYVADHGLSYQSINDVIGALECAKGEFQRRTVDPYEKKKCEEAQDRTRVEYGGERWIDRGERADPYNVLNSS